jgi:ubiquinone/menaquinone biosynthesis C-methylase UbiE
MASRSSPRVNYGQIAHLYDRQPYRQKEADPDLLAFLSVRSAQAVSSLSILDMGCGTGNQLIANRPYVAQARLVGLDLFHAMLRQAQPKADGILWVQADSALPPFPDDSFDFISNQFSFHHVRDKPAMMKAVLRILRPGGRFVLTNICPWEMTGWLIYRYFPAAMEIDCQDFLPTEALVELMRQVGFINVAVDLNHTPYEQDLRQFLETVRRRDTCSQLITIPDVDYQTGLQRLEMELRQAGNQAVLAQTEICLLTLSAEKSLFTEE